MDTRHVDRYRKLLLREFSKDYGDNGRAVDFLKAVHNGLRREPDAGMPSLPAPDFLESCRNQDMMRVKVAVMLNPNCVRARSDENETGLHLLAKRQTPESVAIMRMLVEQTDIDVLAVDDQGRDAVMAAVEADEKIKKDKHRHPGLLTDMMRLLCTYQNYEDHKRQSGEAFTDMWRKVMTPMSDPQKPRLVVKDDAFVFEPAT